jgi:hypothetical protein
MGLSRVHIDWMGDLWIAFSLGYIPSGYEDGVDSNHV